MPAIAAPSYNISFDRIKAPRYTHSQLKSNTVHNREAANLSSKKDMQGSCICKRYWGTGKVITDDTDIRRVFNALMMKDLVSKEDA